MTDRFSPFKISREHKEFFPVFRIARVPAETPNENIDANGHIVMNRVANECHGAEVRG